MVKQIRKQLEYDLANWKVAGGVLFMIICFLFVIVFILAVNENKCYEEKEATNNLNCKDGDKLAYQTVDFIVCETNENTAYISTTIKYAKRMVD